VEFNQIRYFLNLADTLNFTEAAMRLACPLRWSRWRPIGVEDLDCAVQRGDLGRDHVAFTIKLDEARFHLIALRGKAGGLVMPPRRS
jgi:hypothetical protein